MSDTFEYRLFGLRIRSEFPLAALRSQLEQSGPADVVVRKDAVPESLPAARFSDPYTEIDEGTVLLKVPTVARYLVRDGREVVVEPLEGSDGPSIELFLLGSAFGALCQQRGLVPLHASAVDIGGSCVAFAGASGAGKSTLAAHLAARGYPVVCDDVCVVRVEGEQVVVLPADPRVKLWSDGLDSLRVGTDGLLAVRADMAKYHVPVSGVTGDRRIRLAALYVLDERGDARTIERLHGFEAVVAVAENSYRNEFIAPLGLAREHFARCGAIARAARIRRLTRPRGFDAIARTAIDLEADWETLGESSAGT